MTTHTAITRRTALLVGAAGASAAALAACSSSKGTTAAPATAAGSTDAGSSTAGSTTAGSTAASSGAASSSSGGDTLVSLDKVPVGGSVSAKLADGSKVLVARPTATTAACFSAICTHQGCTVAPAGKELKCPCHGSVYDAFTGAVISGPAPKALPKVAVHVSGGNVVAGA